MALSTGEKLGPYEIVSKIGAGGMGEVYKARDTRLDRSVAIKVLPEHIARRKELRARFEREARAVASLNHPHICVLYDIGNQEGAGGYMVMEHLEGETLEACIERGALPMEKALQYALQIADALDRAHRAGVTHRDIKPGNIMLTRDGVKVLDFGLAKSIAKPGPDDATIVNALTTEGTVLGTPQYMAPEQFEGKEADARSDIWAFGAVLYEMLTGKKAFQGKSFSVLLGAVLSADPPPMSVQTFTPASLERLVRRCLNKDPEERYQSMRDVVLDLRTPPAEPAAKATKSPRRAWAAAAVCALAAAVLGIGYYRATRPLERPLTRFQIPSPENAVVRNVSVSPDGRRLAYVVRGPGGASRIWVRSLDTLESHALAGTDGATAIFWSPDSRFLGFGTRGKLKKVAVSGGPAQAICDLSGPMFGGAWAADGTIVFGHSGQVMRVPEAGGTPAAVAAHDLTQQVGSPSFLPDGRHFVYAVMGRGSDRGNTTIYLASLDAKTDAKTAKKLVSVENLTSVVYAASPDASLGYLLFTRDGSLMALPFDARRLEPAGAAVPIAEGIARASGAFSASAAGLAAYLTGADADESRLLWFDRAGKQLGQIGPAAPYSNVQVARDGKLVLTDQIAKGVSHLWSADPVRAIFTRVNPGENNDYAGQAIAPDGRVAFTYTAGGVAGDIYVRHASGAGAPEAVVKSALVKHPSDWSADGRFLMYDEHGPQKMDLLIVPMTVGAGERKPVPFLATPANETDATFSPDGKWIAYSSDESGRYEVYVQGFVPGQTPAAGIGKWQISTAGGSKPYWRRDGKELYYIAGNKMMAVAVKSAGTKFEPGVGVPLFDTRTTGWAPYAVTPDGRFLINTQEEPEENASPITVVLNWTSALKK
ncbi:MAG: protein kinase [Candidatus Solibacter usitatus]|nr:protein kinase [Candidatus Solibacter usitatus]